MSKVVYQKLDPIEHIHHRPDMYVGSIRAKRESFEWVMDDGKMKKVTDILYSQALLRIFVEALSNAIDNVWRSKSSTTPCTRIDVTIDKESGEIRVWNNGLSIPIEKHEDHGIYNPELIFGHLLTGSNYDDKEERYTSGRNGLGIKLTNVFSNEFIVKICNNKTKYEKRWFNNMRESDPHTIKHSKSPSVKNSTEVIWKTDFEKFKLKGLTENMIKILKRYVYDAAMITKVNMYLNKEKIGIKSLKDYANCFGDVGQHVYIQTADCEVLLTSQSSGEFEHIAFTNGVYNKDGGVHVDEWMTALFKPIIAKLNTKGKPQITMKEVKKFFRLFVNCTVKNPEFSSQSKTYLSSPCPTVDVKTKMMNSIFKWDVMNDLKDVIKSKEFLQLKKTEKKTKGFRKIDNFDPANNAGGKLSTDCSLILCEGLSAKTYAVEGISVGVGGKKGRDWFGIYPLRGKLLNVRNASINMIANNKEIKDVIHALNLQYNVDYTQEENYNKLNYGKVIILTDSDVDGIHISGLIMNLFHTLFPTLLARKESFIIGMQTPIVKVVKGGRQLLFYREEEYLNYYKANADEKFSVKYYKGLGTSSNKEIKETFGKKIIPFHVDEQTDKVMNKVFDNKRSDERKKWLETYEEGSMEGDRSTFSGYLNHELIKFSINDCDRSLPCLFDGLKQSQRKILYACFKKNLTTKVMKVAQLAGFVAENTNYHHGEQCLYDTITKMGQDFPGSNNVPYLVKDGQFGSRLSGGKDAASARYIHTKLTKIVRHIFRKEDDVILTRVIDDGDKVEPHFYMPIIPMILVNGCSAGIGTGWSCSIPSYNPKDVIQLVKKWIKKEEIGEILPYYNGYKGRIKKIDEKKFESFGIFKRIGKNKVVVTELPVNMWSEKCKEYLEDLLEKKLIKGMKNYCTPDKVHFEITENDNLVCNDETLHLKTYILQSNMVLFSENKKIKKFDTIHQIVDVFCKARLQHYILRKGYQLDTLSKHKSFLKNKYKFIKGVVDEIIDVYKQDEKDIIDYLEKESYDKIDESYNYLLNISIRQFTKEMVKKLEDEIHTVRTQIKELKDTDVKDMWTRELDELEKMV